MSAAPDPLARGEVAPVGAAGILEGELAVIADGPDDPGDGAQLATLGLRRDHAAGLDTPIPAVLP